MLTLLSVYNLVNMNKALSVEDDSQSQSVFFSSGVLEAAAAACSAATRLQSQN